MIKFFRKIRQQLLTENKFSKYLLYAIGEIVLVVIGILIALQINTWNFKKEQEAIRQNYYEQLLIDLSNDTDNLKGHLGRLNKSILSQTKYYDYFQKPYLTSLDLLYKAAEIDINFGHITFNSNTFETLLTTGDIKLIPQEIRNKLIELNREQQFIHTRNDLNDRNYVTALSNAQQRGFNTIMNRLNNQSNLYNELMTEINSNMPELLFYIEAALEIKNFVEIDKIGSYEYLLLEIEALSNLIKKELNVTKD